ncbi:hypothetical protein SISSUDRAFT_991368 [Sistotremastrum suecicum HHB10207 ss-3]|uniref:Oxidoreductase AflY n=1 Tax=Sistotremastrum suecicum HHB10207 ss-3 TaxID=1314776 RepID=A0A165ZZC9_9AGAM|nr:hypothetical protein SISSUDRAFT_991368 [Sistotremastrum suecicum HHB10207 ss-3]
MSSSDDILYPLPAVTTARSPRSIPGFSVESGQELQKWLKVDAESWHVYFDDRGFHNHLAHHLYAAYGLGASPSVIRDAYQLQAKTQRKAFASPVDITEANWKEHLGDDKYYKGYLEFFYGVVASLGISGALEKYIFSAEANWGTSGEKTGPQMLSRFVSGLLHPLIHAGQGCEFSIPGTVAQGLGWTAISSNSPAVLLPKEFFAHAASGTLSSLFSTLTLQSATSTKESNLHSFSILTRMLNDPALDPTPEFRVVMDGIQIDTIDPFLQSPKGEIILKYASLWQIDTSIAGELEKKLEELSWLMVLIYGVGGWRKGRDYKADFQTMHFVTSSLFLPSIMDRVQPSSQSALLRAYFSMTLAYWVNRGRPALDIKGFWEATNSTSYNTPGPQPSPAEATLGEDSVVPNPWLPLLQSTVIHTDEHLLKFQRAVVHYATVYGNRKPGHFSGTELAGAELLDGSLFLRVAWLTANRLGWMREGQKAGDWDLVGFLDD